MPETDGFFHNLYSIGVMGDKLLKDFVVYNPDLETKQRYEKLLGRGAENVFRFKSENFRNALIDIQKIFKLK